MTEVSANDMNRLGRHLLNPALIGVSRRLHKVSDTRQAVYAALIDAEQWRLICQASRIAKRSHDEIINEALAHWIISNSPEVTPEGYAALATLNFSANPNL